MKLLFLVIENHRYRTLLVLNIDYLLLTSTYVEVWHDQILQKNTPKKLECCKFAKYCKKLKKMKTCLKRVKNVLEADKTI